MYVLRASVRLGIYLGANLFCFTMTLAQSLEDKPSLRYFLLHMHDGKVDNNSVVLFVSQNNKNLERKEEDLVKSTIYLDPKC